MLTQYLFKKQSVLPREGPPTSYWMIIKLITLKTYSVKPGYSGVATLSKAKLSNFIHGIGYNECDPEGRALTLEFSDYYVVNTYVPNSGEELVTLKKRLAWNAKFKQFLVRLDLKKPVICCGDLNETHTAMDLRSP